MNDRIPSDIKLHRYSKTLELVYSDHSYTLSAEFLRVHSPSAEVQQHGRPILQTGKQAVAINSIEAIGHYALKIIFSDGHDTGLYSWAYLYQLASHQEDMWQAYLQQLKQAGKSREAE
ncbi:MAG TPA: DUF971 domain-containing protein [Pseudomonadales bacterium]